MSPSHQCQASSEFTLQGPDSAQPWGEMHRRAQAAYSRGAHFGSTEWEARQVPVSTCVCLLYACGVWELKRSAWGLEVQALCTAQAASAIQGEG